MKREAYFSHSWKPADVPLNVLVWETIVDDCDLYVDHQGAQTGTYYINRLEELIRKSDVFVSVLTFRDDITPTAISPPDYQLRCSPAALFELRLAERARKPRWVVYDDRIGMREPRQSELVKYTPIDAIEELARDGPSIRKDAELWLGHVRAALGRAAGRRSRVAALLIDENRADTLTVAQHLETELLKTGYNHCARIEPYHTDAEMISTLLSSGLLIADLGARSSREVLGMAHAMFLPSIRFVRSAQTPDLPCVLEGHPGGYQHDLVLVEDNDELAAAVRERAEAMRDRRQPIQNRAAGCAYLRRKLYRKHNVFFSHNLAAHDADLLESVFRQLEERGIRAWEYRHNNKSGIVWKEELQSALKDATDVVFLFGNEFELSEACAGELRAIGGRRKQIQRMLPFLWGGRTRPNPDLASQHHEPLPADKQRASDIIVERLEGALRLA